MINMLISLEADFWEHVKNGTPPPLDGSKASADFIAGKFPNSVPESKITLPDNAAELIAEYDNACEQMNEVTERKQKAENQLKELMGDNEIGTLGDRVIVWKGTTQERLDTKALKAEHPELYQKYANKISFRRFSVKAV